MSVTCMQMQKLQLICVYYCLYIYIYIYNIFFWGQKFHSISCHKPKNNQCLTKCYECFWNNTYLYIIYLLSLYKLAHHPYTKEIFDNIKRFALHPIKDKMGGKKSPPSPPLKKKKKDQDLITFSMSTFITLLV